MDPWLRRTARVMGTLIGAFAGIVAIQFFRLRRVTFLPGDPGFWVNHVVRPDGSSTTGPPLRMLVFGDSTTAGVGVARADQALPFQIARDIAGQRGRAVHVTTYGWAGARAADLVRDQVPRSLDPSRGSGDPELPRAAIVVVVVGANDATSRTQPRHYRAALRQALTMIREAAPEAEVVLAGIPNFRGTLRHMEPLIWLTDQYARLLRPISRQEAARAGVAFADLAARLPGRLTRQPGALASDGFHPSALGYRAWADVIVDALGPSVSVAEPGA